MNTEVLPPRSPRVEGRVALLLAIVVAASTLAPIAVALTLGARLPDDIARQWGMSGEVTGTWPLSTQLWTLGIITLLVAGGTGALALGQRFPTFARRMFAGCATWIAVFLASLQIGSLLAHRDLADPTQAPYPGLWMIIGTVGGITVGVLIALVVRAQPREMRIASDPPPSDALRLGPDDPLPERWTSAPMASRAMAWGAAIAGAGFGIAALIVGWSWMALWLALIGIVVCAPLLASMRFHTIIDLRGVTVRGPGFRLLHVPLDEVAAAEAVDDLSPLREFGGWGLRTDLSGRTGVLTRRGEALLVRRGDDREIIITLDEAAMAAAILNTFAANRSSGR